MVLLPAQPTLLTRAGERVERELSQQPAVAIVLLASVGESLEGLRQHDAAARILEQALLKGRQAALDDSAPVVRAHRVLALVYASLGRFDDARRHLAIALASPRTRESATESIAVQLQRHALAMEDSRFDEALDAAQMALRLAQATPETSPRTLAMAWRYSGGAYRAQGRAALAIESYRHAYDLALKAYHQDTRHPVVMETRMGYARSLMMENRWDEAIGHMRGAVDASTQTFGAQATTTGNFLGSLGDAQVKIGDIREGIENCRRGLAIYEQSAKPGTRDHASRLRQLGSALLAARESEAAVQLLAHAVEIRADVDDPLELPAIRAPYALALIRTGRLDEAAQQLAKIDAAGDRMRNPVRIEALLYRGMLHRHREEFADALRDLQDALLLARAAPHSNYHQAQILNETGLVRTELGQYEAALVDHRQAADLLRQVQVRATPVLADSFLGAGRALLGLGRSAASGSGIRRSQNVLA